MRKLTYLFALLTTLLLGAPTMKAETVSPYKLNFDVEISTSEHDFACASGWGHIVDYYEGYWSNQYVTYTWHSSYGRDDSGGLYIGSQTYNNTKDMLVTPAITGTSSIYVKQNNSNGQIKFYTVTKEGSTYTAGDEIEVTIPTLSQDEWTKIEIPSQDNAYIGIWCSAVKIDDFEAESADIVKQKKLKLAGVTAIGGTDYYVNENGLFTITAQVKLQNAGDIDFNPGDENYSLSIINYSQSNAVVGTKNIDKVLPVGGTLIDTISVSVNYADYSGNDRYDVKENVGGTTSYLAWATLIPYTPIMQLRDAGGNIDAGEVFDWGKVNTATSLEFTVRNKGGKTLNVTGISVPEGFTADIALPFSVAAGQDSTFNITLHAETPGSYEGTVTVSGDEVDDFSFAVKGLVLDAGKWFVTFEDQKLPAGSIAEENWRVYQIGYASSPNTYALYHGSSSATNKFISPLLVVGENEKMTFEVGRASRWTSYGGTLNVYYSADRKEWKQVKALTIDSLSSQAGEYNSVGQAKEFYVDSIPAGNYYIAFEGSYVYIDNIYGYAVADVAHDWTGTESTLPTTGMVNYTYTAKATLKNTNAKDEPAGTYTAKLFFGDDIIEAQTDTVKAGESAPFTFNYTPHAAGTFDAHIEFETTDGYKYASDTVQVVVSEEVANSEIKVADPNAVIDVNTSYVLPICTNYNYSVSDNIYTADKLAKAGLTKGAKISKITYKGYNNSWKGDWTVNLKSWISNETDASFPYTYAFPDTTAMTAIYNGDYTIPYGGSRSEHSNLIEISLDEPFVYTGGDIRIFTQHETPSSYTSISFEMVADNGHTYAKRKDNNPVAASDMEEATAIAVPYFSLVVEPSTFSGTVKNAYGEPVSGAVVKLTNDNVLYSDTTDVDGNYSMNVIQNSLAYTLTAEAEDYDLYQVDSLLVDSVPTKDIVLSLTPSTITLTEGEWATFSAKEPIDFAQTDINAYIVTAVAGENATLKRVEKVPARTGVLLYGNGTYTLPTAAETEAVDGNLLVATADGAYTVETEAVGKAYTFANNYFSKAAAGDVVAKKHAYLNAEGAADAVYLVLPKVTFSGTVTDGTKAISGVTVAITDKNGEALTVTTDAEGKFAQTVDQTNFKYVVTAEALGYDGYESDSIVALTDTVLAIVLDRQPIVASISSLGWTSFSSIFPVDLTESGLTAYIVTAYADGKATVVAAGSKVPANTGVLLKGEAGDYTLDVAEEAAALEGNILGNTAAAPLEITSDNYGKVYSFAEVDNAPGFFKDEAGYTIPLGEAYLPVSGGADEFYALYDPTTGITFTVDGSQLDESQPMYNLAGQRVAKSYRGVVVQNGKKFVRK